MSTVPFKNYRRQIQSPLSLLILIARTMFYAIYMYVSYPRRLKEISSAVDLY